MLHKVVKNTVMHAMQVPMRNDMTLQEWLGAVTPIARWLGGWYRFPSAHCIWIRDYFDRDILVNQGDWIVMIAEGRFEILTDQQFKLTHDILE